MSTTSAIHENGVNYVKMTMQACITASGITTLALEKLQELTGIDPDIWMIGQGSAFAGLGIYLIRQPKKDQSIFRFVTTKAFGFALTTYGLWAVLYGFGNLAGYYLYGTDRFVVVHDNKNPSEPHLGIVEIDGTYLPVNCKSFQNKLIDLESLTHIPGRDNEFITCNSAPFSADELYPQCFHFKIEEQEKGYYATLMGSFSLPMPKPCHLDMLPGYNSNSPTAINIEAFTLGPQLADNKYKAYWAHRSSGLNEEANWMMQGVFDVITSNDQRRTTYNFNEFQLASLHVPIKLNKEDVLQTASGICRHQATPLKEGTRTISDMYVTDEGHMYLTAALDGGNRGPFYGTVYSHEDFIRPNRANDQKPEGITKNFNGQLIVGTDNEEDLSCICLTNKDTRSLDCSAIDVPPGESVMKYGISGIAPLKRTFWQILHDKFLRMWSKIQTAREEL